MSALLHPSVVLLRVATEADIDPEVEENLTPGWVGALVIIGLIVITVLLWLSMRRQFGKIRFDDQERPVDEEPGKDGDGGSSGRP